MSILWLIVTIWWVQADRPLLGAVKYCVSLRGLEPAEAGSVVGTDRDIVRLNGQVFGGREHCGPRQKVLTLVRKAD